MKTPEVSDSIIIGIFLKTGYNGRMNNKNKTALGQLSKAVQTAAQLQEIENNPLDADDIAMFAMFERKGWSNKQRRAYILKQAKTEALAPAAE